jgi:glycosyltransferase involved in cell wall biosynthesis
VKNPLRVALVHDWLTGMRGGEKVLELLCELFPTADIFTLVYVRGKLTPTIERHRIITSPLQSVPLVDRYYRHLLPLMPWAIEHFDLSGYDLVISSSHCVAKGVRVPAGRPHWSYCHTPMRYIWDQYDEYFGSGRAGPVIRAAMRLLRGPLQRWDVRTAGRVTHFLANSSHVRDRIQRIYHRDARVLYPPVDYRFYSAPVPPPSAEPYFLIVSALAPYKRIDLALDAFRKSGRRLVVIGEGQDAARLRVAAPPNISFLGWRSNEELRSYYQHCQALIFPGVEDFGIVPLEAMSGGRPVLAYAEGGALETIRDGETGVLFRDPSADALLKAVERIESIAFDPARIRRHAEGFSRERCAQALRETFLEYL